MMKTIPLRRRTSSEAAPVRVGALRPTAGPNATTPPDGRPSTPTSLGGGPLSRGGYPPLALRASPWRMYRPEARYLFGLSVDERRTARVPRGESLPGRQPLSLPRKRATRDQIFGDTASCRRRQW